MAVGSVLTSEEAVDGMSELYALFSETDDEPHMLKRMKTFHIETLYEVGEDG